MRYRVTIEKDGGSKEERVIDAASRFAIYELVEKEGGRVQAIAEEGGFAPRKLLNIEITSGIKRSTIVTLAKNMSAMLNAGLSLSRALSVVERQSSNKRLKATAVGLAESVKKGASFHEALAQYPRIFSTLFVAMVKAGEESGGLSEALSVVSLQMERSDQLARKIKGAMIYPSIVVTAIIIVAILMLIYVVPTLTKTFTDLGVEIPLTTQLIVAASDFMASNAILVFVILILIAVLGFLFVRSQKGSALVLWAALKVPVVGELVRETYTARAARTLSSLLSSGVPVLDALGITREVVGANVFGNVIGEAEASVKKGETLSSAFGAHSNLYPVLMADMTSVGEETGQLAQMLKQVAEFYENDVSDKTKDLSTIIEPVLMLVIGLFVGVFAVSMIAPIYSLSSAI